MERTCKTRVWHRVGAWLIPVSIVVLCLSSSAALSDPMDGAHRGGWWDAPENTLVTFDNTINLGMTWLEVDIWLSADGIAVIHHDTTLDRTTDGTGPIYEKTLAELKALDAGSYFGSEFIGERIPTFEETLDSVYQRARLIIEIKNRIYIPTVADVINNHSFAEEDIIGWVRLGVRMANDYKQYLPNSPLLFGTAGPGAFEEYEIWQRASDTPHPDLALHGKFPAIQDDPRWMELVRSYGLLVFTGPSNMTYQGGVDLDPDMLIVQDPDRLLGLLSGTLRECEDGIDNDGDGFTDYPDDPGCFHGKDQFELSPCSDGLDNDGDGLTDHPDDPGCFSASYPFEAPSCSNGLDDNGDGLIDYPDDPGCFALFDQREGLACNDGLDNDQDGLFDYPADTGCDSAADTSEVGTPAGEVPDGDRTPGLQLLVDRAGGEDIVVTWDVSCGQNDTDYALYEGLLSSFASHAPVACSTSGATIWTFTPDSGSRYYLAVPLTGGSEGSYGVDRTGAERPPSATACFDQIPGACN